LYSEGIGVSETLTIIEPSFATYFEIAIYELHSGHYPNPYKIYHLRQFK